MCCGDFRQQSLKDLPPMLIMGFIYQYWLATAFVLSATVPIAGPLIGDAMTRSVSAQLRTVPPPPGPVLRGTAGN